MSECVVRMEMPENCCECQLRQEGYEMGEEFCPFTGVECLSIGRQNNCPIICQLPEEHGRLIDADAFEKDVSDALVYGLREIPSEEGKQIFHVLMQEVLDNVKKRETIVPAERSET